MLHRPNIATEMDTGSQVVLVEQSSSGPDDPIFEVAAEDVGSVIEACSRNCFREHVGDVCGADVAAHAQLFRHYDRAVRVDCFRRRLDFNCLTVLFGFLLARAHPLFKIVFQIIAAFAIEKTGILVSDLADCSSAYNKCRYLVKLDFAVLN